jgi:hypothetical protein
MFLNIQGVMDYRVASPPSSVLQVLQLDNYDEKYRRMASVLKLVAGKASKHGNFANATALLVGALGKDG